MSSPQPPVPLQQHAEFRVRMLWAFSSWSGHDGLNSTVHTHGACISRIKGKITQDLEEVIMGMLELGLGRRERL